MKARARADDAAVTDIDVGSDQPIEGDRHQTAYWKASASNFRVGESLLEIDRPRLGRVVVQEDGASCMVVEPPFPGKSDSWDHGARKSPSSFRTGHRHPAVEILPPRHVQCMQ